MVTQLRRVAASGCSRDRRQVLIADDDPSYLTALEKAFGSCGFRTIACAEGREAWMTMQERPGIFMAVLNWLLPNKDGHMIFRQLHERRSPVVRVLMIGRELVVQAWEQLYLRADYVLAKPFPAAGVGLQVEAILHAAASRQEPAVSLFADGAVSPVGFARRQ